MKCNEIENSKACHSHMNLDNLDKALHDLGMLSAITEARREFLRESRSNLNVVRVNTRTVGYWMKRTTTKNRLCPYVLPARHRTKSENSDAMAGDDGCMAAELKTNIFEPSTSTCNRDMFDIKSPTKRCQSLENLNLAVEATSETSPEMECVSTRIQKLQVDE